MVKISVFILKETAWLFSIAEQLQTADRPASLDQPLRAVKWPESPQIFSFFINAANVWSSALKQRQVLQSEKKKSNLQEKFLSNNLKTAQCKTYERTTRL